MSGSSSSSGTSAVAPPPTSAALVGRRTEIEALRRGLAQAVSGEGSALLVLGPGGMGKTRLLRWLEAEGKSKGFQVRWGNALKEAISPFFVFQQLFRRGAVPKSAGAMAASAATTRALPDPLPPLALFEEDRPRRFRSALSEVRDRDVAVISRETGAALRERGPPLPEGTKTYWITRMEGEGRLTPGNLDRLAEVASKHLQARPGSVVALDGIEYLVSQNAFPPVLRLLQFLRDVAQETEGHLFVAMNPASFEKREVSLLESDAEVIKPAPARGGPEGEEGGGESSGAEPPSETLLRYLHTLEEASHHAPQLLIVDDLHWVDAQSGTAFQFLARNARNLRVLLVGGAREEEIPATSGANEASLAERLEALVREGALARLPLRGFGAEEARELAFSVLGGPFAAKDPPELKELLRRTDGNPYFLRETIMLLQEEGALRKGPSGFVFHDAPGGKDGLSRIPTSLRRLVLSRIGRLTPEGRAFLDTAAVAGSEFDLAPVASVRGLPMERAHQLVEEMEGVHRLLERSSAPSGPGWIFSHPLVWEVTMTEMPLAARRREARALLDWWEEERPRDVDTLARLAHDAGDAARGVVRVREALLEATGRLAPEAAATYLEWEHELLRAGRRPLGEELAREVSDAQRVARGGAGRTAYQVLLRMLQEELPSEVRWAARVALARSAVEFDSAEARKILWTVAQDMATEGAKVPVRIRNEVLAHQGFILTQEGKFSESEPLLRAVADAPEEEVDRAVRRRACSNLCWALTSLGRSAEGRAILEKAIAIVDGDPEAQAQVAAARSFLADSTGDIRSSAAHAAEAARLYRQAGLLQESMVQEYNHASMLFDVSPPEETQARGEHLLDIGRKFDLPRTRCCGTYLLARAEAARKRFPPAIAWAEESLRDAELTHRADDIRDCQLMLAHIVGSSGDYPRAVQLLERLEHEGALDGKIGALNGYDILSDILLSSGELDRALAAAERFREAAESIENKTEIEKARKRVATIRAARDAQRSGATGGSGPAADPPKN